MKFHVAIIKGLLRRSDGRTENWRVKDLSSWQNIRHRQILINGDPIITNRGSITYRRGKTSIKMTLSHENAPLWICSPCLQTKSLWNTLFKVLDKKIFQLIRYSNTPLFIIVNVYVFCIFMIISTGCDLIVSRSRSQQSVFPAWRTSLHALWLAG